MPVVKYTIIASRAITNVVSECPHHWQMTATSASSVPSIEAIPMPVTRHHRRSPKEVREAHIHRNMEALRMGGSLERSRQEVNLKSKAVTLGLDTQALISAELRKVEGSVQDDAFT